MLSYIRNTIFGYESLSTRITPFYYVKALYSITHFRVRNTCPRRIFKLVVSQQVDGPAVERLTSSLSVSRVSVLPVVEEDTMEVSHLVVTCILKDSNFQLPTHALVDCGC